jgi:hypothetical protein
MKSNSLKCHEIFRLWFFQKTNPPAALINHLKYFEFGFIFTHLFKFESIIAASQTKTFSQKNFQS